MLRNIPDRPEEQLSLDGVLTEAERRFERFRRTLGLILGPFVFLALYLIPMRGLSSRAHVLAAIIGWGIVWGIPEPLPTPVTSLL